MVGTLGRLFAVKLGDGASPETFATVGGVTSKTITVANGTIDVTNDDSSGIKTLLPAKVGLGVAVSLSGNALDTAAYASLRTFALAGTAHNFEIDNPAVTGGSTYSGEFVITSFEEAGETDGVITFSLSLESTGVVTIA